MPLSAVDPFFKCSQPVSSKWTVSHANQNLNKQICLPNTRLSAELPGKDQSRMCHSCKKFLIIKCSGFFSQILLFLTS